MVSLNAIALTAFTPHEHSSSEDIKFQQLSTVCIFAKSFLRYTSHMFQWMNTINKFP